MNHSYQGMVRVLLKSRSQMPAKGHACGRPFKGQQSQSCSIISFLHNTHIVELFPSFHLFCSYFNISLNIFIIFHFEVLVYQFQYVGLLLFIFSFGPSQTMKIFIGCQTLHLTTEKLVEALEMISFNREDSCFSLGK